LLFVSTLSVAAQERNIYNEILKESLKMDLMKMSTPLETDSNFYKAQIFENMDTVDLRRIFFRHSIESLFPNENSFPFEEKKPQIAPYMTMLFYTNSNNEPLDNGKFNGDGKFSGEFATKGDILMSKAVCIMVNVQELLSLHAIKTGNIPTQKLSDRKDAYSGDTPPVSDLIKYKTK
jgi:hypothetical protein